LEAEGLEGFFTGQILCIVALICWYLMVAKEAPDFRLGVPGNFGVSFWIHELFFWGVPVDARQCAELPKVISEAT